MKKWLIGVMTVLMAVSLAACTPTTEKQKKETTAATAAKSQEDKVLSFDIEGKDENAVGTLDLNQAESAEGCSDKMFLTEIGNTFTENFELSKLKLKVNGANYEGDDIKQGDSDYLTYNADYESVE